jgi:hypothetical protein
MRFLARCIGSNVAFKATAGLHHPWRSEYRLTYAHDAPQGTMFGFLNVLLATAALHAGLPQVEAQALLEERNPCAVRFSDKGARWLERDLPLADLEKARDSMAAFGSCSFREPITDLRSMSLL